jgi:hypothetical protein
VAHVTSPSGATRDVTMEWAVDRDGEYRATFTPDEPGLYAVKVDADVAGATKAAPARSAVGGAAAKSDAGTRGSDYRSEPVFVRANAESEVGQEFFDAEMRASLLERISRETGGRFYTPTTVNSLPEDIALSKRGVTVVNQMDLWDMPIVFLLLVSLVTGEWAYRKKRGLV